MNKTILHINASARSSGSFTRQVSQLIVDEISEKSSVTIINRDLSQAIPFVDEQWVDANFTPIESRTKQQQNKLSLSDSLVKELQEADTIVIGSPIYNFSIAAALKAWIDMVARAGVTFKYTANGPVGLLQGKKVYVAVASGGVEMGSKYDFASRYLQHVLSFMGLSDVTLVNINELDLNADDKSIKFRVKKIVI